MKIEWNGGENPVKAGERLTKVWFRSGGEFSDSIGAILPRWTHEGNGGDIIAYEVMPDKVEPLTETLRDRVAMAALTGLLNGTVDDDGFCKVNIHLVAQSSFAIADAFMEARGDA